MRLRRIAATALLSLAGPVALGSGQSSEPSIFAALCNPGCVPGQPCYTLVLRYVVNIAGAESAPRYVTKETFTGENYSSLADAFCAARIIRHDGAVVPVEAHGSDGNVMPESITPMPVL